MLNKVMLIGNLTRDPESQQTNSGTAIAKLGVAVNRTYKDKDGNKVDDTVFVDVDVFAQSAEFCRDYLRKGFRVLIDGRLKFDQWEDRETGQNRSKLGVIADRVQNLTLKSEQQPQQQQQQQRQYPDADVPAGGEGNPF